MGEVHARLDKLSHQLERLERPEPPRLTGAPPSPPRERTVPPSRPQPASNPAPGTLSVDDAIAEIAERQRALYGETPEAAPTVAPAVAPVIAPLVPRAPMPFVATQPSPEAVPQPLSFSAKAPQPLPETKSPPVMPSAPALDIAKLEEQLRNMTARIETLRPAKDIEEQLRNITDRIETLRPASDLDEQLRNITSRIDTLRSPNDLEEQLRNITARIETLRSANDFDQIVLSFRKELADIGRQITEALPRHAVESLQIEVQALAQRIDHSREAGSVDTNALAGLERGLAEVRDALHRLTPAENLIGFDDAVRSLSQKIDLIIDREDPAALQQLETAISALRGIVSHVASNDTLTKVAEDVRALAAKVDDFANQAASGQAVSALESRIDTLANALNASAEAGHAVPRELEKLLSGLIEKLEWVQLTHTDHAALGHLEDRIAQLIKRLDASDARLGNLEAVERGLADLLVHINEARAQGGAVVGAMALTPPPPPPPRPAGVDDIKREVAAIMRADRRTQDSLEAVHGAVEHVVDRLAKIESGLHEAQAAPAVPARTEPPKPKAAKVEAARTEAVKPEPIVPKATPQPAPAAPPPPVTISPLEAPPAPAAAEPNIFDAAPRRMVAPTRAPIDPNLPPDHPLEPGSTPGSGLASRPTASAADRIAASEAAAGLAPAPATAENEKADYLAAARKAAQAAAAAPAERKWQAKRERTQSKGSPQRLRKLLVAGGAVVVVALFVHVVLHMFQDNTGSAISPPPLPEPSEKMLEKDSAIMPPPLAGAAGPVVLPAPGAAADAPANPAPLAVPNAAPNPAPGQPLSIAPSPQPELAPAAAPPPLPQRQSSTSLDSPDVTGSLPSHAPMPTITAPFQAIPTPVPAVDADKLPATIGGPALRAAAAAGDASAEYEIASRFAEGRGVAMNNEQAAHWLQRAADQGSAPAEFRLGGLYEKGVGVKKDLGKARDLYAAAAGKGNGKAMHNLAVLYAEGVNGPADYKTAALWFRKAADRGVTDSEYNLAILYARGIGVEQNYAESYKWFVLAANHGDADAGKKRDEIGAHLDPQSLAAAQAAAQKWTAVAQPDEAINVKTPPGGWDPQQPAKASKPKPAAKLGTPEAKL
jgi:localization factor PodJL